MEENLKQQHTTILKFALFGPESTGKTTLATQLADYFDTVWAPEYARDYLQTKLDKKGQICEPEDLLPIAIGQMKCENDALLTANKYLFCDTSLLVTKVFSEIAYNFCDPILDKAARKHKYDLFFLTDIDVPWEHDGLRDQPNDRDAVFTIFKNALIENNKPFIILSGDINSRFEKAKSIIQNLEKAIEMGFSSHDFVQIYEKGIPLETINNHLNIFKFGMSKAILVRPATKNDGVIKLSKEDFQFFSNLLDKKSHTLTLKKFVPASGAASRMFKFLSEFLNEFDLENESINAYINRKNATNLTVFLTGLEKFPFFENIDKKLKELYSDFKSWESDKKNYHFIKLLLASEHFDFANKPKGILPFHEYPSHTATPVEEHLNEVAMYANSNGVSNLHFTISEIHRLQFNSIIDSVKSKIEKQFNTKININLSTQKTATDTIAVDFDNNPFRNDQGKLVFRPAGHGALIDNLNDLDADIIFIKNIDNVIQNNIETIALYKKGLAGILVELQEHVFDFLNKIDKNEIKLEDFDTIISFIQTRLHITINEDFSKYTFENKIVYIKNILNRPIRVCGMVKNEGEAGGGPFWVQDSKGNVSLQIIETSQIDIQNQSQKKILDSSTYFNPVDLVCGIKDYKENKFNLLEFIDPSTGFIVEKNKNGRELKAYELPGLWNGAMAKWMTIFVEVPIATFNPVKTVNDLLKPAHQSQ